MNKKASVITLHTVANYGTQLQTLATQEKLKEYFDAVEFIDYRRKDTYGFGLFRTFAKKGVLIGLAVLPTMLYWNIVFKAFRKRYINLSKKRFLKQEDFNDYIEDSDVYFVGSDQVWNTGWNNGIIPCLYLNFINKKPKYTYAASFGNNKLTESEIKSSIDYIQDFKYITVREKSGINILKEAFNYNNCDMIIDPTLVMKPEFWRKYKKKRLIKEKYILIYNLNRSDEFDKYAVELSRRTGLPIYRFCTRFDQALRCGKSILIPKVLDFITLIDDAEYVLTDSFHATAFSMNLNTEPICVYPENYSGRISEFLKLVDAPQRHIENFNDFDIINRKTDFEKVNTILDEERKKVDRYLEKITEDLNNEN